jgi:hypothetical protein
MRKWWAGTWIALTVEVLLVTQIVDKVEKKLSYKGGKKLGKSLEISWV